MSGAGRRYSTWNHAVGSRIVTQGGERQRDAVPRARAAEQLHAGVAVAIRPVGGVCERDRTVLLSAPLCLLARGRPASSRWQAPVRRSDEDAPFRRIAGRGTLFPAERTKQGRGPSALPSAETGCIASVVTPVGAPARGEARDWRRARLAAVAGRDLLSCAGANMHRSGTRGPSLSRPQSRRNVGPTSDSCTCTIRLGGPLRPACGGSWGCARGRCIAGLTSTADSPDLRPQCGTADLVAIADAHLVIGEPFHREVSRRTGCR